jgi:hypothetical protein
MKIVEDFVAPVSATEKQLMELNKIDGIKVGKIDNMTYFQVDFNGMRNIYEPDFEKGKDKNGNYRYYILRNSFPLN